MRKEVVHLHARTLKNIRIRVEGSPVQLCDPETREDAGALHAHHGEVCPDFGMFPDTYGRDQAWLLINGSKYGGLPLLGPQKSWQQVWLDLHVEFLIPRAHTWIPIEEWEELLEAIRRK